MRLTSRRAHRGTSHPDDLDIRYAMADGMDETGRQPIP
jgi:hypothetical protein